MKRNILCAALLLSSSALLAQSTTGSNAISKHIAKILSRGDGTSQQTAYKVNSVREEYEVLAALGLTSDKQGLVIGKKPYDMQEGKDPRTGVTREVWFDISSFYPEFSF